MYTLTLNLIQYQISQNLPHKNLLVINAPHRDLFIIFSYHTHIFTTTKDHQSPLMACPKERKNLKFPTHIPFRLIHQFLLSYHLFSLFICINSPYSILHSNIQSFYSESSLHTLYSPNFPLFLFYISYLHNRGILTKKYISPRVKG